MPGMCGIDATREIGRVASGVAVLMVFAAMRAGALGHVLKGAPPTDMIRAVAAIAARLGPAANTVSNHISNIFGKLQVASRAEAIVRARSAELGY